MESNAESAVGDGKVTETWSEGLDLSLNGGTDEVLNYRASVGKSVVKELDLEGLPVDRGWAWALLAGCVLYTGIYGGIMRSYGVFFLQYQERFQAKAAEIAVMGVIENVINSIIGLFVMTIGLKKLSCRTVVAIGATLMSLSYIATGFVKDIRLFYVSLGLFGGAGISMVRLPTLSIIGIYFDKHRGLATSIYSGAASVGGLIFAPIIATLFDKYGFTGTMLIVGGLFFNIFVSASVMRPPSWFKTKRKTSKNKEAARKLLSEDKNQTDETFESISDSKLSSQVRDISRDTTKYSVRVEIYNEDETEDKEIPLSQIDTPENKRTCCGFIKVNVIDAVVTAFEVRLLKDVNFILYLSMAFVLVSGMILVFIYLPPFAKDMGLSYNQIAIMISAMACADFVSKIVSGFVADRKWLRRSTLLAIASFITGTLCHFARFYTSLSSVFTVTAIMACFYGWYPSMYTPVLIDCVGLAKFQSSLGFVSVIHGISLGVFFPITGLLRDISGSYISSFHLAGGLCYIGGILLLLMPFVEKIQKKKSSNCCK